MIWGLCIVRKRLESKSRRSKHMFYPRKRSRIMPARKLDSKMLKYIISTHSPKQATVVARQLNISKSLVYSVRSHYKKTGDTPQPKRVGRPKNQIDPKTIRIVLDQHKRYSRGVRPAYKVHSKRQSTNITIHHIQHNEKK